MLRFGKIVGFGVQPAFGPGQKRSDARPAWQQPRQARQFGHVVNVTVTAGAHAGIGCFD
jgi:hypothetical protein